MSLRSLTTCSYVSDATCLAIRHCTIVVTQLPTSLEPESFRSRDFIMDLHGPDVGIIENGACRWWLIDGCKSLFNVKPSTVPTRLIHELYAHTRTAHPERFLGAETPRRPNTLRHLRQTARAPFTRTVRPGFSAGRPQVPRESSPPIVATRFVPQFPPPSHAHTSATSVRFCPSGSALRRSSGG